MGSKHLVTLKITVIEKVVAGRKCCWEVEWAQTKAPVGRGVWELSVAVTGEAVGGRAARAGDGAHQCGYRAPAGEEDKARVHGRTRKDPRAAEERNVG